MIHRFQSKNCAPVIMLDDLSERIFALMQRPFESTGILLPEQIPNYLHLKFQTIFIYLMKQFS